MCTTPLDFLTGVFPARKCKPPCVPDAFLKSRMTSSLSFNRIAEAVLCFESSIPGGIPRKVRPPAGSVETVISGCRAIGHYWLWKSGRRWSKNPCAVSLVDATNLSTMSIEWRTGPRRSADVLTKSLAGAARHDRREGCVRHTMTQGVERVTVTESRMSDGECGSVSERLSLLSIERERDSVRQQ